MAALSTTSTPEQRARVIDEFVPHLRRELDANAHKGDWRNASQREMAFEVLYHSAKLSAAVAHNHRAAILELSADVANCAAILADVAGVLGSEPPPPPKPAEAAKGSGGGPGGVFGSEVLKALVARWHSELGA